MATSINNANYVMNRIPVLLLLLIINFSTNKNFLVQCRKSPSSSSSSSHRKSSSTSSRSSGSNKNKSSSSKTKKSKVLSPYDDEDDDDVNDYNNIEEEEDDEGLGFLNEEEDDEYDEDSEDDILPSKRRPQQPQSQRRQGSKSRSRKAPSSSSSSSSSSKYEEDEYDNYDDDEYDIEEDDYRPPPSRRGPPPQQQRRRGPPSSSRVDPRRSSKQRGHVVPYTKHRKQAPQPGTLSKGITFLRDSLPSPTNLKDTTLSAISSAKETTSKFSKDIYREVKGLTSSELEQVMLKATKPDDSPIKSKHVERLVGVTYQISGRYDIYDAVLRKLWNKMAEPDWRSKLKALYILHRFSADGSPDHQAALKARLRELRRTKDPKRKGNYFNSKILLLTVQQQPQKKQQQLESATDTTIPYRAFLARYAHYVLLRAQCFSGMFNEITSSSKGKKGSSNNNNNSLKQEHLQASQLLLKAAVSCQFTSSSEECEMTSIALERVAMDLMGLTSSVASSLTASLKKSDSCSVDQKILLKKWCEFYSQNLRPQTKSFVKKASVSLDKYGLFLPSRMSATVSQELLSKGLQFSEDEEEEEQEEKEEKEEEEDTKDEEKEEKEEEKEEEEEEKIEEIKEEDVEDSDDEEEEAEKDEDEYEEYEEEYEYDEYDD